MRLLPVPFLGLCRRDKRKIFINVEHRHINAMTVQTDADTLPLIKKVELFEYAMENTTGQDLYKVLCSDDGASSPPNPG